MIIMENSKQRKILALLLLAIALVTFAACSGVVTLTPYPNEVDWKTTVEILNSGNVVTVFQLHNLDVTLIMNDGSEVHTVEPTIDAIFDEIEKCGAPCSKIMLATE